MRGSIEIFAGKRVETKLNAYDYHTIELGVIKEFGCYHIGLQYRTGGFKKWIKTEYVILKDGTRYETTSNPMFFVKSLKTSFKGFFDTSKVTVEKQPFSGKLKKATNWTYSIKQ